MKIGRNELCPCGSGKKYKKCCLKKDNKSMRGTSSEIGERSKFVDKELWTLLHLSSSEYTCKFCIDYELCPSAESRNPRWCSENTFLYTVGSEIKKGFAAFFDVDAPILHLLLDESFEGENEVIQEIYDKAKNAAIDIINDNYDYSPFEYGNTFVHKRHMIFGNKNNIENKKILQDFIDAPVKYEISDKDLGKDNPEFQKIIKGNNMVIDPQTWTLLHLEGRDPRNCSCMDCADFRFCSTANETGWNPKYCSETTYLCIDESFEDDIYESEDDIYESEDNIDESFEAFEDQIWKMCPCGSGKRYHKCCLGGREPGFAINEKRYNFRKGLLSPESNDDNDLRPNVIMLGDDDDKSYYVCGVCNKEFFTDISDFFPERCPLCDSKFILGDGMCISDDTEFELKGCKYKIYDKDEFGNNRCPIEIVKIS